MRALCHLSNVASLTKAALGGSFIVFNNQGVCRIQSDTNHGCTGYSASFATLDGDDCSSMPYTPRVLKPFYCRRLTRIEDFAINGASSDAPFLKLDICGTEDGKQVAWVTVNRNGSVSFVNQQGETAQCVLNDNLKVRSRCNAPQPDSHQSGKSTTLETKSPLPTSLSCSCSNDPSTASPWPSPSTSVSTCSVDSV